MQGTHTNSGSGITSAGASEAPCKQAKRASERHEQDDDLIRRLFPFVVRSLRLPPFSNRWQHNT